MAAKRLTTAVIAALVEQDLAELKRTRESDHRQLRRLMAGMRELLTSNKELRIINHGLATKLQAIDGAEDHPDHFLWDALCDLQSRVKALEDTQ